MPQLDNRNHPVISVKDKLLFLLKPVNLVKLVKVQQDELKEIKRSKIKPNHTNFIDYLYNHYIELGLTKTYNH